MQRTIADFSVRLERRTQVEEPHERNRNAVTIRGKIGDFIS